MNEAMRKKILGCGLFYIQYLTIIYFIITLDDFEPHESNNHKVCDKGIITLHLNNISTVLH